MSSTGRGLKIAVIDSGVNLRHPHITSHTRRVVFTPDENGEDTLGHGTAVMAAIQEKAPDAEYWAVKIFGTTLRTRSSRLLAAIEWCIENEIDIVNLSLGTPNLESRAGLEALIARGSARRTLLVSARHSGLRPVLPGILDGVVGVHLDPALSRDSWRAGYSSEGSLQFWASGYPRPLPGVAEERNLSGVSFAVANMTGIIACLSESLHPRSCEAVYEALRTTAVPISHDHPDDKSRFIRDACDTGVFSQHPLHHLD